MALRSRGMAVMALGIAASATAPTVVTTTLPSPSQVVYVAMGDSYSSGEGNAPYSDSTSTLVTSAAGANVLVSSPGDSLADGCDRSALATGSLTTVVALSLGLSGYTDVACSGASTTSMLRASRGEPSQVSAVGPNVNLVTITAGGNDAPSWESVVEQCVGVVITSRRDSSLPRYETGGLLPGPRCAAAVAAKEAALAAFGVANLESLYRKILSRLAPTGRLVVLPYPTLAPLANGRACLLTPTYPVARTRWGEALGLSNSNYGRLAGVVRALDDAITLSVSQAAGSSPSRILVAPTTHLAGWLNCQPWTENLRPSGLRGIELLSGGRAPSAMSVWMRPCVALDHLDGTSRQYAKCVASAWFARVASSISGHSPVAGAGSLHPTPTGQSQLAGAVLAVLAGNP